MNYKKKFEGKELLEAVMWYVVNVELGQSEDYEVELIIEPADASVSVEVKSKLADKQLKLVN